MLWLFMSKMAFKELLALAMVVVVTASPLPKTEGKSGYELFEGDMMFTKAEIEAAGKGLDPMIPDGARGLIRNRRWPNAVVPYVLDKSVKNAFLNALGMKGPSEKAIYSAMKEWEEKTCVRFVPRTTQQDYVEFFDGKGCWSYVGKIGGKQQISIDGMGCFTHGIVVHEIGHALGFQHEQSRPDRDSYVEIVWDNIKEDNKHNFKKYSHGYIDSLGVPYDYGSIMHYGKRDFAKWPWQTTIRVKQAGASIGQRSHLSPLDVKQMNLFYECKSKQ